MKRIRPGKASYVCKTAAAMRYDTERDAAPRVVAKGAGAVAERILEAAREAGVPVYEDPDLAALLMTLNIDSLIPPELYMAVAEIFAYIYRLNSDLKQNT